MASKHKSNISWSSILLSILLISAVGTILWVLSDIAGTHPPSSKDLTKNESESIVNIFSINDLANTLVNKHTASNIPQKERSNILQAVKNTLQHLQDTNKQPALQNLQALELNAAISTLTESVKLEEKSREAAKTWVDIGNLQQLQSSQLALYAYKKASKLDNKNISAWNRLGHYYRRQQQFALAENAYNHVLQSSGDTSTTLAVAHANFGLLYQAQSKFEQAETAYLKALEINDAQKNTPSLASNAENLAIIYKQKKNFEASERYYLIALSHYKTLEKSEQIAKLQTSLASLYHQHKALEKAKKHHRIALNIYLERNNQTKTASSYSNLGIINQQQGQASKAKELFEQSLELNKIIKSQKGIADQYGNLGILHRSQNNLLESESSHLMSLKIYQELSHTEAISQQQTNLGFLYQAWDKNEKACKYWQESQNTLAPTQNTNRIERIKALIQKHCPQSVD
ncbi:MAG TPA: tetratricopeptide repeat protein [Leucothrix mucor]|nr:tetratricopeptide repeat protein [Leucothrix mucor]